MRVLDLIVPVFFAVQFVIVLVAVAGAILFAGPQVTHFTRNLR
jgi:hypothetical protein